jgi:hypothetical protein
MKNSIFKAILAKCLIITLLVWGSVGLFLQGALAAPQGVVGTFYVNVATGNDTRTTTEAQNPSTPWKTISKALSDQVAAGSTIRVAAGTYNAANGETFGTWGISGITLSGAGATTTTIDAGGTVGQILNIGPSDSPSVVEGFTFQGGGTGNDNRMILFGNQAGTYSSVIIRNNIFNGGGSAYSAIKEENSGNVCVDGDPNTYPCQIYNNIFRAFPQVAIGLTSELSIFNNTFYRNSGKAIGGNAGGQRVKVWQNIFDIHLEGTVFNLGNATLSETYNSYYGSSSNFGGTPDATTAVRNIDPAFTDPENGDWSLKDYSGCIDAGEDGTTDLGAVDFTGTPTSTITVGASGANYTTITDALNAVSGLTARTISLLDTSYNNQALTLKSNVTLQGAGAANTTISGNGSNPVMTMTNLTGASVSGVTVTGGTDGIKVVGGSSITISNNIIQNNDTSQDTGSYSMDPFGVVYSGTAYARVATQQGVSSGIQVVTSSSQAVTSDDTTLTYVDGSENFNLCLVTASFQGSNYYFPYLAYASVIPNNDDCLTHATAWFQMGGWTVASTNLLENVMTTSTPGTAGGTYTWVGAQGLSLTSSYSGLLPPLAYSGHDYSTDPTSQCPSSKAVLDPSGSWVCLGSQASYSAATATTLRAFLFSGGGMFTLYYHNDSGETTCGTLEEWLGGMGLNCAYEGDQGNAYTGIPVMVDSNEDGVFEAQALPAGITKITGADDPSMTRTAQTAAISHTPGAGYFYSGILLTNSGTSSAPVTISENNVNHNGNGVTLTGTSYVTSNNNTVTNNSGNNFGTSSLSGSGQLNLKYLLTVTVTKDLPSPDNTPLSGVAISYAGGPETSGSFSSTTDSNGQATKYLTSSVTTTSGSTSYTNYTVTATGADSRTNSSSATIDAVNETLGLTLDYTPPTSTSISINSGATETSETAVTLTLAATGASQMMISNSSSFTGADWETYATSKSWTLAETGDDLKTVYAKFRDTYTNASAAINDTITLSTGRRWPQPVVTPPQPVPVPQPPVVTPPQPVPQPTPTISPITPTPTVTPEPTVSRSQATPTVGTSPVVEQIPPTPAKITENKAKLVKTSETSTVYLVDLETNTKQPVFNDKVFTERGFAWNQVETVKASELQVYTPAKPVLYPNNSVIKFTDNKVYEVQQDYELHWIPDEATFEKTHSWNEIKVLPDSMFASFEVK